jgi:hypothetical protein
MVGDALGAEDDDDDDAEPQDDHDGFEGDKAEVEEADEEAGSGDAEDMLIPVCDGV